jgi:SAM-dependent methyltransferase
MSSNSNSAVGLDGLVKAAKELETQVGKKFLADQILRAVDLARLLELHEGMKILAVNPSLGKPWHVLAMRACGCKVTLLGENKKLLAKITEEHSELRNRYDFIPGLVEILAHTASPGEIEYRSGQINLFFPAEDSFDVVCLFTISKSVCGFGPQALLHHSLRGLRDGGKLLAGFLDTKFSDPVMVKNASAEGGFDLDPGGVPRIKYDEYAPDGLLFSLREKSGRSVSSEVIARISAGLRAQARGNQSRKVLNALKLALDLGVRKGFSILVIGPTPDFWPERVMAGIAGQVDIVLTSDEDPDEAMSEFSFFPGIAAVDGGLQLQTALRNPNNRVYNLDYLKPLTVLKSFDMVCLSILNDNPTHFRACIEGLKTGGLLLLDFHHTRQSDIDRIEAAAAKAGVKLEFKRFLDYGPFPRALFVRV